MIPDVKFAFTVKVFSDREPQDVALALHHTAEVAEYIIGPGEREDAWNQMFFHLSNVVKRDGLSGTKPPEGGATMDTLEVNELNDNEVIVHFRVSGVDPGFWRILCGLVVSASECSLPLLSARLIVTTDDKRKQLNETNVWNQPFPQCPLSLPFTVTRNEITDVTRNRSFRISFYQRLDDQIVEELVSAIQSWEELHLGGFPDEGQAPIENASDGYEVYLHDPFTIEHFIPNYLASEAAFDAVISMAAWYDRQGLRVREVEID